MTAPSRSRTRQIMDKAMSEEELLTAITEALTLLGYTWCHWRRSDKALLMGTPGVPDIIAARKGIVWLIELKSERGAIAPEQWDWMVALGWNANQYSSIKLRIWRPSDLNAALGELA